MTNQQDEDARSDVADLTDAIALADQALGKLDKIEMRHRTDAPGPGMSAMARARTDETMFVLDVKQMASFLGVLDKMGGAV
jgi:hypothetical protein